SGPFARDPERMRRAIHEYPTPLANHDKSLILSTKELKGAIFLSIIFIGYYEALLAYDYSDF
ncbi:MAG: hypothetical protein ABH843_00825, partial [Candidatus Omnitrophota bacterium]